MFLSRPLLRAAAGLALLFTGVSLQAQTTSTTSGTGTTTSTTTTTNLPSTKSIGGTTATDTTGPIAVFRLTFVATGDSINYRPYEGGFYVAPVEGGPGSLILTLSTSGIKRYFTYASFGDVFVAVKGKSKKMVLSATAASSVSTTVFYALGSADKEIDFETRNSTGSAVVASRMTGYAVSADSEQDLPYSGSTSNVGVAGASILTAKLDDSLTHTANNNSFAVNDEVTELQNILAKAGYIDGKTTTATGETIQTTNTATGGTGTTGTTGTTTTSAVAR